MHFLPVHFVSGRKGGNTKHGFCSAFKIKTFERSSRLQCTEFLRRFTPSNSALCLQFTGQRSSTQKQYANAGLCNSSTSFYYHAEMWPTPPATAAAINSKQYRHSNMRYTFAHACSLTHTSSHHPDEQIIVSLAGELSRQRLICEHPSCYLCSSMATRLAGNHFVSTVTAWLSHHLLVERTRFFHQATSDVAAEYRWTLTFSIFKNTSKPCTVLYHNDFLQRLIQTFVSVSTFRQRCKSFEQLARTMWNLTPVKVKWTPVHTASTLKLKIMCVTHRLPCAVFQSITFSKWRDRKCGFYFTAPPFHAGFTSLY